MKKEKNKEMLHGSRRTNRVDDTRRSTGDEALGQCRCYSG